MRICDSKLCRGNVLDARRRMPGDIKHLSPSVVGRIDGGHTGIDNTREASHSACELIAESCDCARVRISRIRQVKMSLQQTVLANSQTLALQTHDALH